MTTLSKALRRNTLPPWFDRGFWGVLAIYLWVLPIGGTTAVRNLTMVLLLLLAVVAVLRRAAQPCFPLRYLWLAYLAVAASTLAYALDPAYSLQEIRVEILYPAAVFFIAATLIRSPCQWMRMAWLLLLGNAVLALFTIYTGITGGTTKDGLVGSLNSGVGSYSTYVVTALPIVAALGLSAWREGRHFLALGSALALAANLAALYFTLNRQSFVALFAEVMVIVLLTLARSFTLKRAIAAVAVTVTLATLVAFQALHRAAPPSSADTGTVLQSETRQDPRWPVWKRVVADVAGSPWTGAGFGLRSFNLKYEGKVVFDGPFWHAHNMVLNKAVQMGVPGAVAFLCLFWAVPWRARRGLAGATTERTIALAAIALACGVFAKNMTDDFFTRDGALLYWLLAGATLGSLRHCMKADTP
jgi:O-antigen ligase